MMQSVFCIPSKDYSYSWLPRTARLGHKDSLFGDPNGGPSPPLPEEEMLERTKLKPIQKTENVYCNDLFSPSSIKF